MFYLGRNMRIILLSIILFRVYDKFIGDIATKGRILYILNANKQSENNKRNSTMNTVIEKLQGRRNKLIEQLNNLEEFRRGTVSVIYRKCGKPQCWCAKEGTRGHGPQYLWNATINRKSVAKNLIMGPELEKYLDETERHKRFVSICDELVEVNEELCQVHAVIKIKGEEEMNELKKKLLRRLQKRHRQR